MSRFLIILVQSYRIVVGPAVHFLVPIRSGCRFQPTCSEYMIQALRRDGAFGGLRRGLVRLARCHPFSVTH